MHRRQTDVIKNTCFISGDPETYKFDDKALFHLSRTSKQIKQTKNKHLFYLKEFQNKYSRQKHLLYLKGISKLMSPTKTLVSTSLEFKSQDIVFEKDIVDKNTCYIIREFPNRYS